MNFDIVSVVKIILSLMAIYLIADTISGEREEQTLKMIFINGVTRLEFFLGKYVAVLVTITIPLLAIFLFSSLYITLQPLIQFSGTQWLKLLLIFLSSSGFLSIFILIGLWISVKSSSSSQAMVYGLLIWIIIVFIYPNLANYMTESMVNIPSTDEVTKQVNQINQEFGKELLNDYEIYYPHGRMYTQNAIPSSKYSYLDEKGWPVALPIWFGPTSKFKMEFHEGQVKRMIPTLLSYQDKMLNIHDVYRQKQLKQRRITSYSKVIMPGYLLEETANCFANTSYQVQVIQLIQEVRDYRNKFIEYIKTKDGFGLKYFTQMPKKIWTDDSNELWNNPMYDKYRSNENYPKLDLNDIPPVKISYPFKFPYEAFLILLINLVLFLLVSKAFITMSIVKN